MIGTTNYGWAGHTEDEGVFSNAKDIQKRIFLNYQSVKRYTGIYSKEFLSGSIHTTSYKLRRPNYPNNCLTLDIRKHHKQEMCYRY